MTAGLVATRARRTLLKAIAAYYVLLGVFAVAPWAWAAKREK